MASQTRVPKIQGCSTKLLLFLTIWLCNAFFTGLKAQPGAISKSSYKSVWSSTENGSAKYWYARVIGQTNKGSFLLKSNMPLDSKEDQVGLRSRKYALTYYDQTLSWKWEKPINQGEKNGHFDTVFVMNNKIFAQYSGPNESNEQHTLRLERIDQTPATTHNAITLLQMPRDKAESNLPSMSVLSPNQQLLAIALRGNAKSGSNDQRILIVGLCSEDMQINLRKELSLPEDLVMDTDTRLFLSNDSVLFIAGQSRSDRSNGFRIFNFDFRNEEAKGTFLDMGDKYIVGQQCAYDPVNKSLVVAGLYSNLGAGSIAGVFYCRMNAVNLSLSRNVSHPFSDSFLNQFIGEPKSQNKRELLNYALSHLVLRQDGGVVLLAERRFFTEYSYYDFFTKTYVTRTISHFDNISLLSVSPDGNVEWSRNIDKKQDSQEDDGYYLSFASVTTGNALQLLYNKSDDKFNSVLIQTINSQGEMTTSLLADYSDNVTLIPRGARQVDANTAVFPVFRKNRFYLLRTTF